MLNRLLCKVFGHKRRRRLTLAVAGVEQLICPRCGHSWPAKQRAPKPPVAPT